MSKTKRKEMKIFDGQNQELMIIRKLEKQGNDLLITGKIFGSMPMKAKVKPQEARAALRMLDAKTIWFLLTLLFRKSTKD